MSTVNWILDIVLVVAAVWMVFTVRGIGGIVGRTLTFIVIGAVITGIAHLAATLMGPMFSDGATANMVHRVIVLVGFVFLVLGFQQLRAMKR